MTTAEALREAKRRWGKFGHVVRREDRVPDRRFCVGVMEFTSPLSLLVKGQGRSWGDAFSNADKKEVKT